MSALATFRFGGYQPLALCCVPILLADRSATDSPSCLATSPPSYYRMGGSCLECCSQLSVSHRSYKAVDTMALITIANNGAPSYGKTHFERTIL